MSWWNGSNHLRIGEGKLFSPGFDNLKAYLHPDEFIRPRNEQLNLAWIRPQNHFSGSWTNGGRIAIHGQIQCEQPHREQCIGSIRPQIHEFIMSIHMSISPQCGSRFSSAPVHVLEKRFLGIIKSYLKVGSLPSSLEMATRASRPRRLHSLGDSGAGRGSTANTTRLFFCDSFLAWVNPPNVKQVRKLPSLK